MKITIKWNNMPDDVVYVEENTKVEDVLKMVEDKTTNPIYLCKLDNRYRDLNHEIIHDSEVEFLDISNNAAWATYQDSLVLLYIKAVHDVLGKDVLVSIRNSFNKGLYTLINTEYTEEDVKNIEERMHQLVEKKLPIKKQRMSIEEAKVLAESLKLKETEEMLESVNSRENVEIYSLVDELEFFYGFLVPNTGYLKIFELRTYQDGVLLRYPHQSSPNELPDYEDQTLLYNAFEEVKKWGNLLGIKYVSDLNNKINDNDTRDMYLLQEALHEKKISDLADDICAKGRRLVLICGPSSSGKTTFAKRLCIQLRVNGYKTLYMGTDDYFVESEQAPYDENGERDYESIRAIDTNLFVNNLKGLLAGEMVDLPTYSFETQSKSFGNRMTQIGKDEIIVIEGIHALNKQLTAGIDDEDKYKIYISPFTPLGIDHHNRISATDCRLLRRMVRDHKFRNWSCATTIDSWPKVRAGEDNNIFPYLGEADVFFNSNCIYELAVLKKYAAPLLEEIDRSQEEYAEAQRLLSFLRFFDEVNDDEWITNSSIIREFIGGSAILE